jgi:hypothetical protein
MLEQQKSINIVLTYGGAPYDAHKFLPRQVQALLHCSPVRPDLHHYWWRAVSASYVARPNRLALRKLRELRVTSVDPKQCIATFVRHGDKGIEMQLLDFDRYRSVAEEMWKQGLLPATAKEVKFHGHFVPSTAGSKNGAEAAPSFNGTLFVTTEDPVVLKQAEAFGAQNNWRIVYTNLFDRAKQTAVKTWDEQHKRGTVAVHDDLEYLSMLLNLEQALQCEAWVCTLASNSCRIMDELRTTVAAKSNRYFADLSTETCEDPPCVADHGKLKAVGVRRR